MSAQHATNGTHAHENGIHSREVRTIPLAYNIAESDHSATQLILALFPEWKDGEGQIEFTRFKDGITNTLMKAVKKRPGVPEETLDKEAVLLRAYGNGTEILIDRERETISHKVLAQHQLAPQLLARFENGLLYRFIPGRVCSPADLAKENIWRGVAQRIAQWHAMLPISSEGKTAMVKDDVVVSLAQATPKIPGAIDKMNAISQKPVPNIWSVMQKWIMALSTDTEEERAKQKSLQTELERSAAELSNTPGLGGNGLVFGHCDLLSGNVIVPTPTPPLKSTLTDPKISPVAFIDYEYATPSPPAFDLANHFSEWGGFECDYSALPTRSVRRAFIEEYMASYNSHTRKIDPNVDYVSRLSEEIDEFRGIPGLYWGIWALIQAKISQIDFDYARYAETRLGEYWDWRAESEGTRKREGKEKPLRERRWAEE